MNSLIKMAEKGNELVEFLFLTVISPFLSNREGQLELKSEISAEVTSK